MTRVRRTVLAVFIAAVASPVIPAFADLQGAAQQPPQQQPAPKPEQKPEQKPEEPPKYEETVVVSASKSEGKLINAPATMSVITSAAIESAPTQNFAELLRSIPGVNLTQVSARDINVTSRGATGTLATGQLALLDGRSLYQDFFGFVMWDFLPVNLNEIKQIEVIRGPASAVWGANALYGVVNVITKSPREMPGTSVTFGLGNFDRSVGDNDADGGSLVYFSGTHAAVINDRWAFKLSGGGYSQDALARPTGIIPGSPNTPYPPFTNTGTTQPKLDGRLDYDGADGSRLSFTGGYAGTEGIMHSGIGPFDIDNGSVMGYGKVSYTRRGLRASFFTNILDGTATNLLTRDPLGQSIDFDFKTNTYDLEISNVQAFAGRHVLSYGGNFRYNDFELSLAPLGDNRKEFGIYAQDEIFLSDMFRWVIGARVDRFDYIDDFVWSPRTTFMIKPQENQTFRVSYNRAYRSPSVINNFLDVTIAEPINLGLFSPALAGRIYPLPINSDGNPDLEEQLLDAFEVGYTGVVGGRTTLSAAFYVNRTQNDILFTELTDQRYTAANPPPGWPLPPQVIALVPGASFPAQFTYLNFGKVMQRGLELGVDTSMNRYVNVFANYSWQGEPDPEGFDLGELNLPPENRFNVGVGFNYQRFLGNLAVSYSDDAFWQDVLDDRFHGTTESYTLVNGGFGIRWFNDQLTTSVKVINLGNNDVQQHVFGDIMKRQVVGELRVQF
jgi:outer membrane receptor protein involved in Fe transport